MGYNSSRLRNLLRVLGNGGTNPVRRADSPSGCPLPLVALTTVSAFHAPQAALSVESLYWISYPVMVLPEPTVAPLQDSVTFPSASAALTEHAVGAPQAVMAHRILLLSLEAEARPRVSTAAMRYLV